jgi:hypothetical protein
MPQFCCPQCHLQQQPGSFLLHCRCCRCRAFYRCPCCCHQNDVAPSIDVTISKTIAAVAVAVAVTVAVTVAPSIAVAIIAVALPLCLPLPLLSLPLYHRCIFHCHCHCTGHYCRCHHCHCCAFHFRLRHCRRDAIAPSIAVNAALPSPLLLP